MYVDIYLHMCVCVCVCVCGASLIESLNLYVPPAGVAADGDGIGAYHYQVREYSRLGEGQV
jgi:hypothetical protein